MCVCGPFVDPLWCLCGAFVVPLWCLCGPFVVLLWCFCGAFVVPLWSHMPEAILSLPERARLSEKLNVDVTGYDCQFSLITSIAFAQISGIAGIVCKYLARQQFCFGILEMQFN